MAKKTAPAPMKDKGITVELCEAMVEHAQLKVISLVLDRHGPVFARALVPSYARDDWSRGTYAAWYIAHVNADMLHQQRIDGYVSKFQRSNGALARTDGLAPFVGYLKDCGYVVLHSVSEDGPLLVHFPEDR